MKYSKVKKLEKICFYFCEDYTAMDTAKELGISRQTINHYYKILREKLNQIFQPFDSTVINELLQKEHIHIKHAHIYNHSVFFVEFNKKILVLNKHKDFNDLYNFFENCIKEPLSKHKKANCARVLYNQQKQSFLISGFLKETDKFNDFLHHRLKQFRGLNKQRLLSHFKESQIRYNYHSDILYQRLIQSFL